MRRPAGMTTSPAAKSWPLRRIWRPSTTASLTRTISPSRVASSCNRMASAPDGTTLPVNSRTASPGPTRTVERMTGGRGADHAQTGIQNAVRGPQRIAVHRRDVGGGLGQTSDDALGGDAVPGVGQGDDLGGGWAQGVQDASAGFLDTDHAALQVAWSGQCGGSRGASQVGAGIGRVRRPGPHGGGRFSTCCGIRGRP